MTKQEQREELSLLIEEYLETKTITHIGKRKRKKKKPIFDIISVHTRWTSEVVL